MIAASGCGCAPDSVVRWIVVGVLIAGGIAIWLAGRRQPRHGAADGGRDDPTGATARGWARRGPNAAAAVIIVLAAGVAIVRADADVALAVLVTGAVVASVGMGIRRGRRGDRASVERSGER